MKLVIAIVRPEKLKAVSAALSKRDICVMSVSQVVGYGREPGVTEFYRGTRVETRRGKLRLEIAVNDCGADDVVEAIVQAAYTGVSGQIGDGKVFVVELEQCVRIRDRACGTAATGTPLPKETPIPRVSAAASSVRHKQPALRCN